MNIHRGDSDVYLEFGAGGVRSTEVVYGLSSVSNLQFLLSIFAPTIFQFHSSFWIIVDQRSIFCHFYSMYMHKCMCIHKLGLVRDYLCISRWKCLIVRDITM